jgi:hypothetical protein
MSTSRLAIALSLLGAPASIAVAQEPDPRPTDPVVPYTPQAAVRAVDRFVAAFNAGDPTALRAAFAPAASAFTFDKDGHFRLVDWLPSPWSYHQLQAHQLEFVNGSWNTEAAGTAGLGVLQRIVSGSFVAQRERISFRDPDGRARTLDWMVHYQIANGRIHRLWIFPVEELDVPVVADPRHEPGAGAEIWIDAGHGNHEMPDGTYFRFAELLRRDGHTVRTWEGPFTPSGLDSMRVLVIANAMPATRTESSPTPSAFTPGEEQALEDWVAGGGALLLIADHQPMAGASASLAARFGVEFRDGMARDTTGSGGGDVFRRSDGTLRAHEITAASPTGSAIDSVVTYLGQAFRAADDIQPILVMPGTMVLDEPAAGGRAARHTPVGGWLQGGVRIVGRGRVAVFGEAWMFRFFDRGDNAEFVLNLMDWLADSP